MTDFLAGRVSSHHDELCGRNVSSHQGFREWAYTGYAVEVLYAFVSVHFYF